MVAFAAATAGTQVLKLEQGRRSDSRIASYPMDSVKATEYQPYDRSGRLDVGKHEPPSGNSFRNTRNTYDAAPQQQVFDVGNEEKTAHAQDTMMGGPDGAGLIDQWGCPHCVQHADVQAQDRQYHRL